MEMAKKAEYDWAWCSDHEKAYFRHQNINFYDRNFFVWNWSENNFFKIGK